MAIKEIAWSYSTLNTFETCPRQYYEVRYEKNFKEPQSSSHTWGLHVHSTMERALRGDIPQLPETLIKLQPLVNRLREAGKVHRLLIEDQLAFSKDLHPLEWFHPKVWLRIKNDVGLLHPEKRTMLVLDWKTGKVDDSSDQLKLVAIGYFHTYPQLEEVKGKFVFVGHNHLGEEQVFKREELPQLWNHFLPTVQRFNRAHEEKNFPPKPSGLCRKHCVVTSCEYHGKGSR